MCVGGCLGAQPIEAKCKFADDKVPGDLISQKGLLIYLRTKSSAQHDFIDHCIMSSTNDIQREIKVKSQKLGTVHKYFGAVKGLNP